MRILLFTLVIIAISGCSKLRIESFPADKQAASDINLTSQVSYTRNTIGSHDLVPPLEVVWEIEYNALPGRGFTLVNEWILFGMSNGYLAAASLNTGELLGKKSLGNSCPVPPTVYNNILYQVYDSGSYGLVAYDIKEGEDIWRVDENFSNSAPVVVENKVYHASVNGFVSCFNYLTGELIWRNDMNSVANNSLSFSGNLLIHAGLDGNVAAIEYTSGIILWEFQAGSAIFADPVIEGEDLFISTHEGDIFILELKNGLLRKIISTGIPLYHGPTIDKSLIFIPQSNGMICALERRTYTELWSYKSGGPAAGAALVTDSYVYFTSLGRNLIVLDKKTGTLLQDTILEGRPRSTPLIKDGKLLISCENKKVIAYAENISQ